MNNTALMDPPHPSPDTKQNNLLTKSLKLTKPLRDMAPEALVYTFMAKSICSQDHEDAAGRLGKALSYAHPDECPSEMGKWARHWIEEENITRHEAIDAAGKIDPTNVARVLTSAMDVALQGFCATARSMEYLQVIQAKMPKPEFARSSLRVVG